MNDDLSALTGEITTIASDLPPVLVQTLAQAIRSCAGRDWSYLRLKALQVTADPGFRSMVERLLRVWQSSAPPVEPDSVALALSSTAMAANKYRSEQTVDLVWTGPDVQAIPLRRTDQVLREVIESAQRSLLIVSFAVYRIPAIAQAIVRAAKRRVRVRICVEWSDDDANEAAYDTIRALGPDVVAYSEVFAWPRENRPKDQQGRTGILHAKLAVADLGMVFISSANLTEYALNLNMELGVLVHGGHIPEKVVAHFDRLISTGVLARVAHPPKE